MFFCSRNTPNGAYQCNYTIIFAIAIELNRSRLFGRRRRHQYRRVSLLLDTNSYRKLRQVYIQVKVITTLLPGDGWERRGVLYCFNWHLIYFYTLQKPYCLASFAVEITNSLAIITRFPRDFCNVGDFLHFQI